MGMRSAEDDVVMPEAIESRTFTTKMRGYDPDEVQAFLEVVAATLRDYKDQADRAYQAVGEEMGEMLQQARDRADAMIADADQEATDMLATAKATAEQLNEEAMAEATATRDAANRDAMSSRAEAEQAAARIEQAAREEATRLATDAATAAAELRTQAQKDADERTTRADERVRLLLSEEERARRRIGGLSGELLSLSHKLQEVELADGVAEEPPDIALTAPIAAEINLDVVSDGSSEPASR